MYTHIYIYIRSSQYIYIYTNMVSRLYTSHGQWKRTMRPGTTMHRCEDDEHEDEDSGGTRMRLNGRATLMSNVGSEEREESTRPARGDGRRVDKRGDEDGRDAAMTGAGIDRGGVDDGHEDKDGSGSGGAGSAKN